MKDAKERVFSIGGLGLPHCPDEECCSEEECCTEMRGRIPVQAQALFKKIQTAQFKLDTLLGLRDVCEYEKAAQFPPVKETSLLLQAAHEEMNILLTRLTRLVEWFV